MKSICLVFVVLAAVGARADDLLYSDNFDSYTVGQAPASPWTSFGMTSGLVSNAAAHSGTKSIILSQTNQALGRDVGSFVAQGSVDFWFYTGASPNYSDVMLYISNASTGLYARMLISSYSGLLNSTSAGGYQFPALVEGIGGGNNNWVGVWHHLQVKYDVASKTLNVFCDGVQVGTNIPTYDPAASTTGTNIRVYFQQLDSSSLFYVDDWSFSALPMAPTTWNFTGGYYVIAMKWVNASSVNYNRLAKYTFNSNGTISSLYWHWYQNGPAGTTTNRLIGHSDQMTDAQGYTIPHLDESRRVKGNTSFLGSTIQTRTGTWTLYSGGIVGITWSNGKTEYWRRTWYEPQLTKIELYYSDESVYPWSFYLFNNAGNYERNVNAPNAGWGFGGTTPNFTVEKTAMSYFNNDMTGKMLEWNGEGAGLMPVANDSLMLLTYFWSTTASPSIERYGLYDTLAPSFPYVYCYAAIPSNSGNYKRRFIYQCSHDFGNDGHIENDNGHIQSCLQILDTSSIARGVVGCQVAPNGSSLACHISAGFYLDDWSYNAQIGICGNN